MLVNHNTSNRSIIRKGAIIWKRRGFVITTLMGYVDVHDPSNVAIRATTAQRNHARFIKEQLIDANWLDFRHSCVETQRDTSSLKQAFGEIELILSAGDHVVASVIEELELIAPVKAVAGNSDKYRNPEELPEKRIIKINGHRIGLIHGWGESDEVESNVLKAFKNDSVEAIVHGHTHIPCVKEYEGVLLINPGSPTKPRAGSYKSVSVLFVEKDQPLKTVIIYL